MLLSFSPRPWGCFFFYASCYIPSSVFPTSVGVFLHLIICITDLSSFPHVRGGVSTLFNSCKITPRFSPRPWGCFLDCYIGVSWGKVFPTSVGVFLLLVTNTTKRIRFPHVRGGVSLLLVLHRPLTWFSPRPWGVSYSLVCFR